MKTDTMMEHLPNPIRFIINHISSWPENRTEKPICSNLYQEYHIWYERNDENSFTSKKFGKTLPTIGIECKQVRINGKREWQYILDRSKIMNKLRESSINVEEFFDTLQAEISTNTFTEILIFNISEIVTPQPEKIESEKDKNSSLTPITNMIQDLFDSIID